MNTIKLNYEDTKKVASWNATEEWIDSLQEIVEHLQKYGFLFNEFRLIIGDNVLQYRVEIDKDVFNIVRIEFNKGIKEEFVISYIEYLDSMIEIFENGKPDGFFESDIGKNLLMFNFVNYVIYKSLHQEVILVEETKRRYTKSSSKAATKKVYSLTECIRKYTKHVNKCKHVYTCEHWEVRGHFRHYKSGKVVFVKPFEKGKNKNVQASNKVYTL